MKKQNHSVRLITGLKDIFHRYRYFIIDAWGVLHDGVQCYPGVLECLDEIQRREGKIVIVSNAARRVHGLYRELERVGIERHCYNEVVCSGELAWKALSTAANPWVDTNRPGYWLGPERSRGLMQGLEIKWTNSLDEAGFVLNAGAPLGNPADASEFLPLLKKMRKNQLPMICANPDIYAVRGGEMGISAGAIAQCYESLGAKHVSYYGKPAEAIYQRVEEYLGYPQPSEVLGIGDALATDILGAKARKYDALLISSGIHRDQLTPLSVDVVERLGGSMNIMPDFCCSLMNW